jgi:hypothetical protein
MTVFFKGISLCPVRGRTLPLISPQGDIIVKKGGGHGNESEDVYPQYLQPLQGDKEVLERQ